MHQKIRNFLSNRELRFFWNPYPKKGLPHPQANDFIRPEVLHKVNLSHGSTLPEENVLRPYPHKNPGGQYLPPLPDFFKVKGKSKIPEVELSSLGESLKEIHFWVPHKAGDEDIRRVLVNLLGSPHLLQDPLVEHRHPVAERHRFHMVVGDEEKGCSEILLKAFEFHAHLFPELCIEVGEWFIHEENPGISNHGPSQGHALLFSSTELIRLPLEKVLNLQHPGNVFDSLSNFTLFSPPELRTEGEGEIVINCQVRVQDVILEDESTVPIPWCNAIHSNSIDEDIATIGFFQAADDSKRGCFSSSGWPKKHQKLSIPNLKGHTSKSLDLPESFLHIPQNDLSHSLTECSDRSWGRKGKPLPSGPQVTHSRKTVPDACPPP